MQLTTLCIDGWGASGGRVDGFDFTVLKHRKIKTFQGNNFTVSSALVIKLKVVEWCLTVKN